MSCYIGLHYSLYYRDDSHALWHVRRFKWWGFYGLFLNYVNQTTKSNLSPINYQKICVNKNVLRKPLIRSSGFPKSKTNFLPTVVTISFISNKTRHSYSKWAKKRLSWISKVLALFKKLQFTINSNKKIVPIGYCHKNRPFVMPHNNFSFQKNKLKISRKSWDQNYSKSKTM